MHGIGVVDRHFFRAQNNVFTRVKFNDGTVRQFELVFSLDGLKNLRCQIKIDIGGKHPHEP